MGRLLRQAVRCCLHKLCRLQELLLHLVIVSHKPLSCQRLDPADSRRNPRLRENLECRDSSRIRHMRTAAELNGEIPHADYTDDIAVFLSKQRRRARLPCLFDRKILYLHRQAVLDLRIHDLLYLPKLTGRQCREMCEVKPKPVLVHQRSCLLYMIAKHHAQSLMKQMGRTVVVGRHRPLLCIHLKAYGIAHLDHAACHMPDMAEFAA